MPRPQRVRFDTVEEFHREHTTNLSKGGVFLETSEAFELRERVTVELALDFCQAKATLEAEVVHIVPSELAASGARPGVALQFLGTPAEVKHRLEPLVAACGSVPEPPPADNGRRAAPRFAARIPVRVDGPDIGVEGTTRNLSRSGVLVAVPGEGIPNGQRVSVTLEHPGSGEAMEVAGTVVRAVETGGDVAALGIHFDPPAAQRAEVERFVAQIQSIEHTRRLGGISGPIGDLGPQNLVQMFGNSAPIGTLVLRRGQDEGLIGFENRLLRYARLGPANGMKALARLLAWEDGAFEFFARLEPVEAPEPPLPLEAAIFTAVQKIDEAERIDRSRLPGDAKMIVDADGHVPPRGRESLSKVEQAVLDLARAGFTIQRIVDVIPEVDSEILWALGSLVDRGIVSVDN